MITEELLYEMILKRKSFHLFRERLELTEDELCPKIRDLRALYAAYTSDFSGFYGAWV